MRKTALIAATTFLLAVSPSAHAQDSQGQNSKQLSATDLNSLTEARISILKATLQLTPEQEKLWPAIEDAIQSRARNRQARLSERIAAIGDRSPLEIIRDRDPIAFLNRRAAALTQRGADLKKLADAWEPLYKTLTPEQKRRMAFLTLIVLRELRDAAEERRMQDDDYYYDEE